MPTRALDKKYVVKSAIWVIIFAVLLLAAFYLLIRFCAASFPTSMYSMLATYGSVKFAEDELRHRALRRLDSSAGTAAVRISLARIRDISLSRDVASDTGFILQYLLIMKSHNRLDDVDVPPDTEAILLAVSAGTGCSRSRVFALRIIESLFVPTPATIAVVAEIMISRDEGDVAFAATTLLYRAATDYQLPNDPVVFAFRELWSSAYCRVLRRKHSPAQIREWLHNPELIERVSPRPCDECDARGKFLEFIDELMRASMANR